MAQLDFQEYKKFTPEEKELWNFELKQSQQKIITEILDHAKITNGRVNKLETWNSVLKGAILVISAIVIPVALRVLELHLAN
jgi:hypothetical protein